VSNFERARVKVDGAHRLCHVCSMRPIPRNREGRSVPPRWFGADALSLLSF
jgi:hypothetical protein